MNLGDFIRNNHGKLSNPELSKILEGYGIYLSPRAIQKRASKMGLTKKAPPRAPEEIPQEVQDLVEQYGSGLQKVRLSKYQMGSKDEDGNPQITDLSASQVVYKPTPQDPLWPVLDQAKPIRIEPIKVKKNEAKYKTAVVLPDPQIGYRRTDEDVLDPFHDESAINVALQITRSLNPDLIVNLGDLLDFPTFSKFDQEVSFQRTTQNAIDRAYRFLVDQRTIAPNAEIRYLEGNHDRRLIKSILRNNMSAFGLRQAESPDSWPVLSVPYLLRLHEIGVKYVEGYPANSTWINDRIKCIHGHIVRSGGSTAKAVSHDERVSTIFGHVHRLEAHYKTVGTREGEKTNLAISPGTLARIDGATPSTKGSFDSWNRPIQRFEDWQQGLAIVSYIEGDGDFAVELVYINRGKAIFRGVEYIAQTAH